MTEQEKNIYAIGQVLLINKPLHWTSFDVIRKIRKFANTKKVGHAGTLDPLATGLLIICTGKFTKRINEFMAREKEYTGSFTIGATTQTYDVERAPENFRDTAHVNETMIHETAKKFTGEIWQVPPAHSAIKQNGKRVYELARQGKTVILEPRKVTIKEFEIVSIDLPVIRFRVVCTTGTYIRSLANDFGEALNCGAYLSSLCRTRIGEYLLKNSMTMEDAEQCITFKTFSQSREESEDAKFST